MENIPSFTKTSLTNSTPLGSLSTLRTLSMSSLRDKSPCRSFNLGLTEQMRKLRPRKVTTCLRSSGRVKILIQGFSTDLALVQLIPINFLLVHMLLIYTLVVLYLCSLCVLQFFVMAEDRNSVSITLLSFCFLTVDLLPLWTN